MFKGYNSKEECILKETKYFIEDPNQPVLIVRINENESCLYPCFSGTFTLEILEKNPGVTRAKNSQKFIAFNSSEAGKQCSSE